MDLFYFLFAVTCSFFISFYQAYKFAKIGSDHPVHVFLAATIRENNHRLYSRVPRLLNESHCGAYPLFLHWLLSFIAPDGIRLVAALLNPVMNTLQVVLVYLVCSHFPQVSDGLAPHAGLVSLLFALTPQFHHAFSARNYGLSSRSIGIVLLALYVLLVFYLRMAEGAAWAYLAVVALGYLMWGFNTFSQQAMTLFSVISGIVFGHWDMLLLFLVSLLVFVALHPNYAASYIKYTLRFICAYARELSAVFVLKIRYSIWRDLVYDIWVRLARSLPEGIKYAYNNSLVLVLALNPLAVLCLYLWFSGSGMPVMTGYFAEIAFCGVAVFLLTSFRMTRFLGEPERYVEFVTLFSTVACAAQLLDRHDGKLVYLFSYFVLLNILQLCIVVLINRKLANRGEDLVLAEEKINELYPSGAVRFCSNSEEYTKRMMTNFWQFARLWTADQEYGGYKVSQAFTQFPYVNKPSFEAVVKQFRINACMLDKRNFATVFENEPEISSRLELLLETDNYVLYRLNW